MGGTHDIQVKNGHEHFSATPTSMKANIRQPNAECLVSGRLSEQLGMAGSTLSQEDFLEDRNTPCREQFFWIYSKTCNCWRKKYSYIFSVMN